MARLGLRYTSSQVRNVYETSIDARTSHVGATTRIFVWAFRKVTCFQPFFNMANPTFIPRRGILYTAVAESDV